MGATQSTLARGRERQTLLCDAGNGKHSDRRRLNGQGLPIERSVSEAIADWPSRSAVIADYQLGGSEDGLSLRSHFTPRSPTSASSP